MPAPDRVAGVTVGAGGTAGDDDVAMAETALPLSPVELRAFLADIERLLRLNPLLAIERWTPTAEGFRFSGRNESNGREFDLGMRVQWRATGELELHYDAGLKRLTRIEIATAPAGTRLVVSERYPRIEDAADPRVAEVDKSLVPWVAAIRRHVLARRRWRRLPGWTWWNESLMLSMPPRGRRIVRLLVWIALIEWALFALLALAWRGLS